MSLKRDLVAGVGFRTATAPEEIVALVRHALSSADLPANRLRLLATAEDRAGEAVIAEAAAALGCAVLGVSSEALRAVDDRVPTRSARIERERGVGSLAEAAALASAGEGAALVLSRIASSGATCALALAGDSA